MEEFVNVFKALSDQTRLKIVWLLDSTNTELCVCEIMDSLNESQYNISKHLKVLKSTGIVKSSKDGRWMYYSLSKPRDAGQFFDLIIQAIQAIPHKNLLLESKKLNKRMTLRKDGKCVVGINSDEWRKILSQLPEEDR